MESNDQALADQLAIDYRHAELAPVDRQLCDFAIRLTVAPGSVRHEHIQSLKATGLDDAAIACAVQVIGYFNYINRIANGLGVPRESWMEFPEERWHALRPHDWDVSE